MKNQGGVERKPMYDMLLIVLAGVSFYQVSMLYQSSFQDWEKQYVGLQQEYVLKSAAVSLEGGGKDLSILENSIPAGDNRNDFSNQIDGLIRDYGLDLVSINFVEDEFSEEEKGLLQRENSLLSGSVQKVKVQLQVRGSDVQIRDFIRQIESEDRFLNIIELTYGQSNNEQQSLNSRIENYVANIDINIYYRK